MAERNAADAGAMQFKLPDLGEGVKEGQVLRLLVPEGARVEEDQLLLEVETDKSAVEIPSPFAGVVERWHVKEQQVVNVGDVMVTITDGVPSATPAVASAVAGTTASKERNAPPPTQTQTQTKTKTKTPTSRERAASPRRPASPAVRKLARQRGIDLETITGSGPGGRILRADLDRPGNG
ncbi:MAG: E3 binding domain-containing protein, partial [Phycisphaerae bacterium]|nr:E3 binding domain-containing protein [Phycisphaerae bacterium]